jgi:hypothetical protein
VRRGGLRSNSGGTWETRDGLLDGRVTVVARVGACGPFGLLLTQADEPPVRELGLGEQLAVGLVVVDKEDEEGSEDEREEAGAEEGHKVGEGGGERRRRGEVRLDHRGRA